MEKFPNTRTPLTFALCTFIFSAARKGGKGGGNRNVNKVMSLKRILICSSYSFPPKGWKIEQIT